MTNKQWIKKFVLMHKRIFFLGITVVTLMTLINLMYPFLNGKIVNTIFYDKDIISFLNLCVFYTLLLFFNQFIIATLNNYVLSHLMTGFVFDIRRAVFKKLLNKRGEELLGVYSGDIISRMNNDAAGFANLIFWDIFWGYSNVLHITFAIGFMFYYNIILGFSTAILVPIIFFISQYFKIKTKKVNSRILADQGKLSSYLFEIVKNLQQIKIMNAKRKIIRSYIKKTSDINKATVKSGIIGVTSERVNSFITVIAQLIIFFICSYFIIRGQMQLGVFVAAMSYFNMAVKYFSILNGKIVDVGKQNVSIQRIVDILNGNEEDYKSSIPPKQIKSGDIDFKNVTFGYIKDHYILDRIYFHIEAGSTIGVVGKSGAGKTTLVNLLYNLYHVVSGEILIDGINIDEYNLHSLRSQIGIVHQENILYDATLRYNLSFSNSKDNDEALIEAIKKAALFDTFTQLPSGLDTLLGVDGQALSGGQKQRLAIARVFVKNPRILILDEATSFLDSCNEVFIQNVLIELSKEKTLIIIAHRLSTIKNCDKILVLDNGEIKGFDSHYALIKNNETYINLYKKQYILGDEQ